MHGSNVSVLVSETDVAKFFNEIFIHYTAIHRHVTRQFTNRHVNFDKTSGMQLNTRCIQGKMYKNMEPHIL